MLCDIENGLRRGSADFTASYEHGSRDTVGRFAKEKERKRKVVRLDGRFARNRLMTCMGEWAPWESCVFFFRMGVRGAVPVWCGPGLCRRRRRAQSPEPRDAGGFVWKSGRFKPTLEREVRAWRCYFP